MSQGGLSACARCRDPPPWWHRARIAIRCNSIRIPQEDTRHHAIWSNSIRIPSGGHAPPCYPEQLHPNSLRRTCAAMLSGLPQGEAHGTREHHTSDDSISYPDRLSGWKTLTKVSKPCYVIPPACHSPRSAALQWCVRTPCPDIFAMDSKELSSISDCFGDKKTIKTPKLNTILIRIDYKGP